MSKYLEHIEFNGTDIILRDAEARGLIQENTNEIASVKAKANLNEQKINALTPRVTAAEADIVALDGRLDVAESDIDNLEVHMSAAEDDIDSLEDRMTSAEGNIDALGSRMTTAEGDIDALEGRMDTAEGDIDSLQEAVDQHADLIDGLNDDVTALEGRMDAAEDKNDEQDDKLDELDRKIAASTYEAGIGIYFGQGVDHTNINVEDELITELHNATTKNIQQDTRLTNIENGTTKLPYGKALSVTPDGNNKNLNLLDPNNNVLSSVQLPKSGTQLKYDDQGTLTNISEAELGTGLEYDDTTDTINCTAETGTKIFSPDQGAGTPTHSIKILNCYNVSSTDITISTPSDVVLDDVAATDFSDFNTFNSSVSVGDFILLDLSAISTQIESSLSGNSFMIMTPNWNILVNVSAGYDQAEFVDHGSVAILEVTEQYGSATCKMLYASELYPQLYIGSHLYVRDNTLNVDVNNVVHTRFATSSYQLNPEGECYQFTDFTATDAANAVVGTILYVEHGTNLSIYIANGLNSIIPSAPQYMNARNDYIFIKVAAPNVWKLLKIYRPSSNEYWNSIDFTNVMNFLLHMLDTAELMGVKYKDSNYPVPTLRPADSSGNVLTYEYWAYAENENRRIEVFMFNGVPNFNKFRVTVPRSFVPLAATGNNNDYDKYEDTLYPLYYDGTYYKTITTTSVIYDTIVVVYEKAAPVNYLGN